MKYIVIVLMLMMCIFPLFSTQIVFVNVFSTEEADGTVYLADSMQQPIVDTGWGQTHFNVGYNLIALPPINDNYDPLTLYANAVGGTATGGWGETTYQQGFSGDPPTIDLNLDYAYEEFQIVANVSSNADAEITLFVSTDQNGNNDVSDNDYTITSGTTPLYEWIPGNLDEESIYVKVIGETSWGDYQESGWIADNPNVPLIYNVTLDFTYPVNTIVEVYSNIPIDNASVKILNESLTTVKTVNSNLKKGWNNISVDDVFEIGMDIDNWKAKVQGENVGYQVAELDEDTASGTFAYNSLNSVWEITDIELCYDNKPLHNDWNWESFPKLPINTTINNGETDLVPELSNNIHTSNYNDLLLAGTGGVLSYVAGYSWNPNPYNIRSSDGMNFNLENPSESRYYQASGTRLSPLTSIDLQAGWNWIGYWIPHSQMSDVAFGASWGNVKYLKSEDWYYAQQNNQRGGITPVSTTPKPLHYGEGYMVYLTEPETGFSWTSSSSKSKNFDKTTPENYTVEIKADYEVIDLVNLDPEINEIGVFEGDVCVGAVVVDSPNEQILAYTNDANRNSTTLTFEVIYGRSNSATTKSYQVFNEKSGEFENNDLISGNQQYSIIMFTNSTNENQVSQISSITGNYPNPFNPSTTISFTTQKSDFIDVTIYNLKGQKIKTILTKQLDAGTHSVEWNGTDSSNKNISSGVYFCKLKDSVKTYTHKLLLMK